MEKGGGGVLGARAKPSTKRRRKGMGFAKAIADYLMSDSYMYAPLINLNTTLDSSPSDAIRTPNSADKGAPIVRNNRGCR